MKQGEMAATAEAISPIVFLGSMLVLGLFLSAVVLAVDWLCQFVIA